MRALLQMLCLFLVLLPAPAALVLAEDETPEEEAAWFTNVAGSVGLEGVKAKDAIFTDLNGDGWWDLCIDRRHVYLSRRGARFARHEATGIPNPAIRRIPLDAAGTPDEAKAKDVEYVPHHLYFADLDNDGDQDAIAGVHAWWQHVLGTTWTNVKAADPGLRTTIYLNDGKGRFKAAKPSGIGADDAVGPAMALAILDYDNDGSLDLYEGREYRRYGELRACGVDRLWKGDGKGGFTDVTKAAGLWTSPSPYTGTDVASADPALLRFSRPTFGVTHADWNNDGHQDLLQMAYGRQWNYLWKNNGDGTFTDVGLATGFAGDAVTHGRYPDFVRRPPERPFRSNGNTFDCAVGDLDNDGDLDCLLGEIAHFWAGPASDLPAVLMNEGKAKGFKFERLTVRELFPARTFRTPRRWNFGDLHTAFLDVDNDGRLDVLIGSGDYPDGQYLRLYRQKSDGEFEEVTTIAGFDWEGCGDLSIGDFDRDGDVDILAGRSFMRLNQKHRDAHMGGIKVNAVGLFRNDIAGRNGNHWLNVRLRGKGAGGANRSGLGARILVTTGDVTQMRELRGGSGLANHQDPAEACFGLGKAKVIDRLEIRWPDAKHTVQVFEKVPADRFVIVRQGSKKLKLEAAAAR